MDFKTIINRERQMPYYQQLEAFVNHEYQIHTVYPPRQRIFHCFNFKDYEDIKVVIIGQDPYHEEHQANGLAFSVAKGVPIPPSLVNIYKEAHDDVGIEIPRHGDLSAWANQGVLLLNTVLTVQAHRANSHKEKGWEVFTNHIIEAMNQREKPLVFILWGRQAIDKAKMIDQTKHCVITSPHPSPLSAYRGFFGSKPFSKTNQFLISQGIEPIDWRIR
ncbi:MAG: uracil-DNA glycosylase [Massilimicrobiota timonensis]